MPVAIITLQDITDRKYVENILQENEEKFRSLASSAHNAIIMIDNEGTVSFWNDAAKNIFGYSNEEIIGKDCHLLLAPEYYHEAFIKGFPKFKTTGAAVGNILELTAVRKDGTEFPVELSVSAIKLKNKWNAIGILRDITRRKRIEEELEKTEK
ncbi:PAS domain S-box protein [Dissulfurispira sp.]|uniref:PAS domain S-box protein n=1 Tax=Dissulfurispira sp. TaxID=2817609 RepID=UPI002FDB0ADD